MQTQKKTISYKQFSRSSDDLYKIKKIVTHITINIVENGFKCFFSRKVFFIHRRSGNFWMFDDTTGGFDEQGANILRLECRAGLQKVTNGNPYLKQGVKKQQPAMGVLTGR